ncbi:DsbA family protein [Paenibacillus wynnii]|uniref:DsbA family protein n=1 Tax=Paenibacillus wynnii TaxID=268407 RepID=UPI0027D80228|nr:thioredoxin domain-containing protein [Paenibacillus wynnii]
MSPSKKNITQAPNLSKQEKRIAEQARQRQKNRIFMISTITLVVILFAALFYLASRESGSSKTAEFDYSSMPRLGKEDAPIKLVEFGDFKCPACADFTGLIKPQIVEDYVDQGKAALYFVNMSFIGPDSTTASLAALSVYHQNNEEFWKFYDAIYANQGAEAEEWATKDFLVNLAKQEKLSIDYDLLSKDIENQTYADELEQDNNLASENKVTQTPSLFVNGEKVLEPFNYEAIQQEIETAYKAVENP